MNRKFSLRKKQAASSRGRRMAAARWAKDRAVRERLAEMERACREELVIILRSNRSGEERVIPYGPGMAGQVRYWSEKFVSEL